jgi:hypothetical protein
VGLGTKPYERFDAFVETTLQDQPAWRLRDEPDGADDDQWEDVDQSQRDQVCRFVWSLCSCPIHDCADERAEGDEEVESGQEDAAEFGCAGFLKV